MHLEWYGLNLLFRDSLDFGVLVKNFYIYSIDFGHDFWNQLFFQQ